jgi:hypothetical protein
VKKTALGNTVMDRFTKGLVAFWNAFKSEPASTPTQKVTEIRRFFIAGENQNLWRGVFKKGDAKMTMQEWVLSPFSGKREWTADPYGVWQEDKNVSVKEITVFQAESKFPGSAFEKRYIASGKQKRI